MAPELLRLLLVLAIIVALSIWMASFLRKQHHDKRRRHHWVNGLLQPAVPLQQPTTPLQPAGGSSQPTDMSMPAVPLSESTAPLDPAAMNLIAPGSEPATRLCGQDPLFPGCPMGQQFGGMTLMAQTVFPNSYMPPAVFNTSGFVPGCEAFNYAPDPCWQ